jgi:hypothetical protein
MSEVMTIVIHFHDVRFRDFKTYSLVYVLGHLRREFPRAVSYQRFGELMSCAIGPLCAYVQTCMGQCTGMSFVEQTARAVCHHRRIGQHRVVRGLAQRGTPSMGWCSGFKRHGVINHRGELLAGQLTSSTADDRHRVPKLAERVWGRLFADTGYLSQPLTHALLRTRRLHLVTHISRTVANRLFLLRDTVVLRRRSIMEPVCDHRKHLLQLEHTRHWSATHVAVNLVAGLVAYCHQPNKPSIYRGGRSQRTTAIPN